MSERTIIRARDVMKSDFVMVDGLETVAQALETARTNRTRVLIVNRRDEDDEYGLVLLSDIAKQVIAKDRSPQRVNVYEIMTKPVIALKPSMDVRYVARLFDSIGISMAPVIDQHRVLGVVSYTDIVLDGLI